MFYEAQNAGDTEQIAALMAEDVEYHDMVCGAASWLRCVAFPVSYCLCSRMPLRTGGQVYADPFQGCHEVEAYFRKVPMQQIRCRRMLALWRLPCRLEI